MGVTYEHFLIPEDNTLRPGDEGISRLVVSLHRSGYLLGRGSEGLTRMPFREGSILYRHAEETGCFVQTGTNQFSPFPSPCSPSDLRALGTTEYRLVWPVTRLGKAGLKYPLADLPYGLYEEIPYELILHLAEDYLYVTSEILDPFENVNCPCGENLSYWVRDESPFTLHNANRIHRRCPDCGAPFRPQDHPATFRDATTGDSTVVPGGLTYRFAISVDCGRCFPRDSWPVSADPDFVRICSDALGFGLKQLHDMTF